MLKHQLNYPYITLLALPYLINYLPEFLKSNHFNLIYFLGLIFTLTVIDGILRKIEPESEFKWIAEITIWGIIFYTFYGFILVEKIQSIIITQFNYIIRGRALSLIGFFIFIAYVKKVKPKNYFFVNTFLLILIFILTLRSGMKLNREFQERNLIYSLNVKPSHKFKQYSKSTILIILDEYSSPMDLFKITKDSTLFDFSKSLKKNNWVVREKFFSYEISTIHSLGSIFNYNLSKNNIYSLISTNNVSNYFLSPHLINDLETNNIKLINLGIFELKDSKPLTRLYFYPKNIFELIFQNSVIYNIKGNTNFRLEGLKPNYHPMAYHNKWLFENLTDSIKKIKEPAYIYTHFYMPHAPIHYFNEFVSTEKNSTLKYIEYWKFTNKKLRPILKELGNNYRIILTGDHGFRFNNNINARRTFAAFLGFTENDLKNIKSVQDLGKL